MGWVAAGPGGRRRDELALKSLAGDQHSATLVEVGPSACRSGAAAFGSLGRPVGHRHRPRIGEHMSGGGAAPVRASALGYLPYIGIRYNGSIY